VKNESRHPASDTNQPGVTTRWPVLARLSDASTELPAPRPAKQGSPGGANYRFDPPQAAKSAPQPITQPSAIRGSTKLTGASRKSAVATSPHVFERRSLADRSGRPKPGQSPILPHSNPFSNPRPRLIDSITPVIRFLTMVALFTALATWVQMSGRHAKPAAATTTPPATAAKPTLAPVKNAINRATPPPTAVGPIESHPESGARVGRAKGDDFAARDHSPPLTFAAGPPSATPPHFLIAGRNLPHVQTSDPTPGVEKGAGPSNSESRREADDDPSVARGFLIEIPTRY